MERFISYGVDMFIMRSSDILNKIQIKCNRDGATFMKESYKNNTPKQFEEFVVKYMEASVNGY